MQDPRAIDTELEPGCDWVVLICRKCVVVQRVAASGSGRVINGDIEFGLPRQDGLLDLSRRLGPFTGVFCPWEIPRTPHARGTKLKQIYPLLHARARLAT